MTLSVAQRVVVAQQGGRGRRYFHQLKLLQTFQPWSLDEVIAACHTYGYTGILAKALDGSVWMSNYDGSPDAIGSLEQVQAQAARVRSEGLYYACWTNPLYQGDMALEATLYGQVARECDMLFLDVEPYAQFFGANRPVGAAQQFMTWLRNEAPTACIVLQPDPRSNALNEIRVDEWLPFVDALAGQHYWSDFGTQPQDELAYAWQLAQRFDVPILPTLPGNAPLAGFPWDEIAILPGFVAWRWGSMPQATLEVLGRSPVAGFTSTRIAAR